MRPVPALARRMIHSVLPFVVACSGGDAPAEDSSMSDPTESSPTIVQTTVESVLADFAARDRRVVTLSGYSGSGYEDEEALRNRVRSLLEEYDPASTIINIGATPDGIGAAYEIASEMGFETTGIVSSQALEAEVPFSDFVDRVYVIEDALWGGFLEGTNELSPTSRAMVEVSDAYLAIGGGSVAGAELAVAREQVEDVRFFAADLNHARAIERAEARGEPEPTDFRGAAHAVFGDEGSG